VITLAQNPSKAFNSQQGKEGKYLAYIISEGKIRLNLERISGIIKTKQDLRKFLGVIGYCRFGFIHMPPKQKIYILSS
jgi:hypothetical protein